MALAGLGLWVLTGASAGQDIWPPLFLAVLAAYAVIRSLIWLFLGIGGGDGEGLELWSGSSDGGDSSDGGGGDGGD